MHKQLRALLSLTLLACVAPACATNSEGRGRGGTGGVGGTGSDGGTGGDSFMDAGSAGVGGSFIVCNLMVCRPPADLGAATGLLWPCCTTDARCGLQGPFPDRCLPLRAAGRDDPACPTASFANIPLAGCCTPQGACGLNVNPLSLGCVERRDLSQHEFIDFGGRSIDIACFSAVVDAGDSDSGSSDAGDPLCEWAFTNFCDPVASCHHEDGTPVCECPAGYADLSSDGQRGTICRDINECLLGASVCDGGTCVNTVGSFRCN